MKKAFKKFCRVKGKHPIFLMFVYCLAIFACSNEAYFNLGDNMLEPKFKIVYIDTCFAKLSTIKIDSVPTYNQGAILVGKYKDVNTVTGDPLTGTTTAVSFMEIVRPQFPELNINTVFDSIVLEMRFNGFYMGDTLNDMHLMIYKLAERISKDDEYSQTFYNYATIATENTPLVEARFPIRPSNTRSGILRPGGFEIPPVRIKLPNELGQDLFDKMKDGSVEMENSSNFLNYFKGLAFKAGDNVNTIIGLNASDSSFNIRLHYHLNEDFISKREISLGINASKQFNNIVSDRSDTQLRFTRDDYEISLPNNQAYIMAGDGLFAKIEFPYIANILQLSDYSSVEKAILEIKPVQGTYQKFTELPRTINIYAVSQYGESSSQLVNSQNQSQIGDLFVDPQFWNNTAYTYDVSDFIKNKLYSTQNSNMYLALRLPNEDMQRTIKRLVIGNNNDQAFSGKVTLKLYYNMYNN